MQWKPRLKIYQGSNRKNTFNPETFEGRSYGHWLYVTKIKGKVIFNDYSYSVTTNGHQGEMRAFLRETLKINLNKVIFVNQRDSLTYGISLNYHYGVLALAEVRLKLPKRKDAFYKEQKAIIKDMTKQIATLKKLGAKSDVKLSVLRTQVKESELRRIERQREKAKIAREKRNAVVTEFKSQYESTDAVVI